MAALAEEVFAGFGEEGKQVVATAFRTLELPGGLGLALLLAALGCVGARPGGVGAEELAGTRGAEDLFDFGALGHVIEDLFGAAFAAGDRQHDTGAVLATGDILFIPAALLDACLLTVPTDRARAGRGSLRDIFNRFTIGADNLGHGRIL